MEKVIQNSPALVQLKRLYIAWIEYVELPGLFDFIKSCVVMHDGCAAESTASVLQSGQIFPGSSLSVTVLLNTNWEEKDEALFPLLYAHLF